MKKETFKYQISNVIRYTADAFFYPFYSLFLLSIGKTDKEIGIVLMIIPLISIFINPLWSFFAKNVNYNKKLSLLFSLVEGVVILSLLAFTNLRVIIFITIILGMVNQPFYLLFESFTTVYTIENNESYSKIRLFGSLGYAIGVMLSGVLIKYTGKYVVSFLSVFVLYSIVAAVLYFIKPLKEGQQEKEKGNVKELFKNKNYVLFLGFYVITVAMLFGGDSFWGPYFVSRGIDESMFGIISLGVYLFEVVCLYFFSKYENKIKLPVIMVLIVLFNSLRFILFSLNVPFALLVTAAYLRGFTMAAVLFVVVKYLSIYINTKNITLGMILFGSFKNLFQMIITLSGGFIIDSFSYEVFYLIIGLISLVPIFLIKYRQTTENYDIINKEL